MSKTNPDHYANHAVSPIDLIESYNFGTGFNCGNAIKYISRHKEKNGNTDLIKAIWYLLRELGMPISGITDLTKKLENIYGTEEAPRTSPKN